MDAGHPASLELFLSNTFYIFLTFNLSGSFQHQCVREKRWKAALSDLAAVGLQYLLVAAGWGSGSLGSFLITCGSHRRVGLGLEKP